MDSGDSEEPELSELCAICHSNPPKYKCPRCSIKTCSLACIRRHKLLSECSGIRDPTTYKKRSELARPDSFDQDFNFIAGLERSLERADRDAQNRGIPLGYHGKYQKPLRGEHRLGVEQERAGVNVRKAPVGLSRNKQNRSHWNQKHKRISWTVEWILPDGEKIFANCLDSIAINQAFTNAVPKKLQASSRKRKLDSDDQEIPAVHPVKESGTSKILPIFETTPEDKGEVNSGEDSFYLHCPDTGSSQKRVVHVAPSSNFADALKGHLVLEFPTIYVLPSPPRTLPEGFHLDQPGAILAEERHTADEGLAQPHSEAYLSPRATRQPEPTDDQIIHALQQDLPI